MLTSFGMPSCSGSDMTSSIDLLTTFMMSRRGGAATATTSASLLGKYWYSEPTLTPATSAIRLVLALSKPSLTRMRAVASISASTVARDLSWEAFFRGFVAGLRAMVLRLRMLPLKRQWGSAEAVQAHVQNLTLQPAS